MKKLLFTLVLLTFIPFGTLFAQTTGQGTTTTNGPTGPTMENGQYSTTGNQGATSTSTSGQIGPTQADGTFVNNTGTITVSDFQKQYCPTVARLSKAWLDAKCNQLEISGSTTGQQVQRDCATIAAGSDAYFTTGCYAKDTQDPRRFCSTLPVSYAYYPILNCAAYQGVQGNSTSFPGAGSTGTNPYNANRSTTGSSMVSGSAELSECTNIKLLSLLDILVWAKCVITVSVIPLLFILAFVYFLWSVLKFMTTDDKTKKDDAQKRMWWGLVGLFVMVSLWGIINIVGNVFGVDSSVVPMLQTTSIKK